VASLQQRGNHHQHQRPGERDGEHRVLVEPLHGRHEGVIVGAGEVRHDRDREREVQAGDERDRHQRREERRHRPSVTVGAETGLWGLIVVRRLGHRGCPLERGDGVLSSTLSGRTRPNNASGSTIHARSSSAVDDRAL
jgi:hypothetical protein